MTANGSRLCEVIFYEIEKQNYMKKEELIKKHLEGWNGLQKSSIDHFAESGKASGSFFMALKAMLDEHAENVVKNNLAKADVSGSLPNDIDLLKLKSLLSFSDRYEISIQFWPQQTAVYIAKDDVDLTDFGGDFDFAIGKAIEYLNRITGQ